MLNGDGLRVVLWVAGCNHCCRECQNPITWDPNGGLPFTEKEEAEIFAELDKDYISGITFSGGDPLYTGSRWEEIQQEEIVRYLDVLVDGEFQVDKLDQSLKWKGSSNQRVINVPATLREQKIVLHAD